MKTVQLLVHATDIEIVVTIIILSHGRIYHLRNTIQLHDVIVKLLSSLWGLDKMRRGVVGPLAVYTQS